MSSNPKRKQYQDKWLAERREFVATFKKAPCMDCGVNYPPYVMDFDHRDPSTKVREVAVMVGGYGTLADLFAEIEKCDLVCSNCHRIRTHNRRLQFLPDSEPGQ